jgi:hypothetical protein
VHFDPAAVTEHPPVNNRWVSAPPRGAGAGLCPRLVRGVELAVDADKPGLDGGIHEGNMDPRHAGVKRKSTGYFRADRASKPRGLSLGLA